MNSEKQRQAINEQELQDDIAYVQEVRKNDLHELSDKKRSKFGFLKFVFFLLSCGSLGASVAILICAYRVIPDFSLYAAYSFLAVGALMFLLALGVLIGRPIRGLKVVREDLCPEYVPENNLVLNGNEKLAQSDAPVIRKIVDDPNKRKIKIDNRKVARYVSPDLTFPKMKEALRASFSSLGYELSESHLSATLSRLGHSRVIFLSGLGLEEAKAFSSALSSAFAWSDEFVSSPLSSFDELRRAVKMYPGEKSSLVLSLFGLDPSSYQSYFAGYMEALADCSSSHAINEDFNLSNNLLLLVYLPEGGSIKGIPSILLRYGTCFAPHLVEAKERGGAFEAVKTNADEVRYLASKTVKDFYFDDQFATSFDCFERFEEEHGANIPNDCENALERMEAVELCLKTSQEEVVEDVLLSALLPYYLSKFPSEELEKGDGLIETLKKEFSAGSLEGKIDAYLASYKASASSVSEDK